MAASKLKWQLLTKKRGSSTQGVPASKGVERGTYIVEKGKPLLTVVN